MKSFIDDGYLFILKRNEDDYVLSKDSNGTVSYDLPRNWKGTEYSFEEAESYWLVNADKRFEYKTKELSEKEQLHQELNNLQSYLNSTDWMVVKCMERGLVMSETYPEDYEQRQLARDRINVVKEQLNV